MGGIQKLNKTRTFSVIIGGVLLFAFLGIFTPTDIAKAVGNCPGSQVQGNATNGKDTTKCYNVTQNRSGNNVYVATGDTPAGQTPSTPNSPATPSSPPAQNPVDTTADPTDGTTCAVEKIGWILCPVIETAATIADKTFSLLANNFLQVDPRLLADQGAKPAWEQARNLANIMFVVAFLAIIYSQITGSGLNNYGIKRMLPRLIIAAIAVNASYYICQIMVDLSNIMGFAIKAGLTGIANDIGPSILSGSAQGLNTETSGGVLAYIAIAALALAGFIWLILGPLALIITTVVVTAATIIAILLLRKAILILLVVISPIAFVLYLLPNTEKLFDKWLKMFWGLLMVFPVVALLFGSGQLASTIILMAGSAPEQYTETTEECVERKEQEAAGLTQAKKDENAVNDGFTLPCEKGFTVTSVDSPETAQSGMMLGLVATGIAVAPLLAVWAVLKGALSAAGAIGGRIAAGVQKGTGGAGSLGNKAYEKSAFGRGQAIRKAAKENYKNRKFGENLADIDQSDSRFKKMRKRYTRAAAGGIPGVLNNTGAGGGGAEAQASALRRSAMSQNMKAEQEDISGAQAELQYSTRGDMGQIANKLAEAIRDGNEIQAKAAENMLMGMGGGGIDKFASAIIEAERQTQTANSSHVLTELKQHTGQHHGGIKEKSGDLNGWMSEKYSTSDTGQISGGGLQSFSRSPNAFSGLSDDQIATQSHASLHAAFASDALNHSDATRILESTSAAKLGGAQRQMLTELATNRGPNAASTIAPRHAPTDTTRV